MKRMEYRGYITDTDNLGRPYIYNTASPYSEDSDHVLVYIDGKKQREQIKAIIDACLDYGYACRYACVEPDGTVRTY